MPVNPRSTLDAQLLSVWCICSAPTASATSTLPLPLPHRMRNAEPPHLGSFSKFVRAAPRSSPRSATCPLIMTPLQDHGSYRVREIHPLDPPSIEAAGDERLDDCLKCDVAQSAARLSAECGHADTAGACTLFMTLAPLRPCGRRSYFRPRKYAISADRRQRFDKVDGLWFIGASGVCR